MGVSARHVDLLDRRAVDGETRFAAPGRDADPEGEIDPGIRIDGDRHGAIPGIAGGLPDPDRLAAEIDPRAARARLERILVEVGVAGEGHAAEDAVVERALELVGEPGIREGEVHVPVEEGGADGRAGLEVGIAREEPVRAEALVARGGDEAGEEERRPHCVAFDL